MSKKGSCKYTFTTKNPFSVGSVTKLSNNQYLILLSGNYRRDGLSPHEIPNSLPYIMALGEPPCRKYHTVTSQMLPIYLDNLIKKSHNYSNPNALINYNLANDDNKSIAFEIIDMSLEKDNLGDILSLKVKIIKSSDGLYLDTLDTKLFNISLVIEGLSVKKNHVKLRS